MKMLKILKLFDDDFFFVCDDGVSSSFVWTVHCSFGGWSNEKNVIQIFV